MLDEIIEKHCSQHFHMGALGKSNVRVMRCKARDAMAFRFGVAARR